MQALAPRGIAQLGVVSATAGIFCYLSTSMRHASYTTQTSTSFPRSYSSRYDHNIILSNKRKDDCSICTSYNVLVAQKCNHFISFTPMCYGWFSNWFGSSEDNTAASTRSSNQYTNTPTSNENSEPSKSEETAIKPTKRNVGLTKRLRLLFFTKLMHKAVKRVQETQEREVEDAVNETKRILKDLHAKLIAIRNRVHKAEQLLMKRFLTGRNTPKLEPINEQATTNSTESIKTSTTPFSTSASSTSTSSTKPEEAHHELISQKKEEEESTES